MFGNHTRFEVINNGIDLTRFITPENKANEYTFCINARFDPQKNPYFVVDVIDKLVKKESKITLEWIGSGYMEREIKQYTKKMQLEDHIKFLGTTKNVENVLWRNKYFLLPSQYEGLGIVLIEAQAAGLKCFISDKVPMLADCGGCVEISLDRTAEEWANIILNEINNKKELFIDENQIRKFDIHYTTKVLEKVYENF